MGVVALWRTFCGTKRSIGKSQKKQIDHFTEFQRAPVNRLPRSQSQAIAKVSDQIHNLPISKRLKHSTFHDYYIVDG